MNLPPSFSLLNIPNHFINTVTTTWGDAGKKWLTQLPKLVDECDLRWNLRNIETANNLSHNYIARGWSATHSTDAVLKICMGSNEFVQEIVALRYYNSHGCVTLLDYDFTNGAMLLEAIYPGDSLKTLFPHNDEQATHHLIDVIKKIHHAPLSNSTIHPTMAYWLELLQTFSPLKLPTAYLDKANKLALELLDSQPTERYLLHGDLHHENILFDNLRGWLAIDPKGVIGELAYEVGAFIRNPLPPLLAQPNAQAIVNRRFDQLSQGLNIDRKRLVDWSYVHSVLAACWTLEDGGDWQQLLDCADLIEKAY